MEPITQNDEQAPSRELGTAELVARLSEQMSRLARDEMRLARLEMTRKGKAAGIGIGVMGGSGVIALYAVGCLLGCAIIAISGAVAAWLAALIVGAALLLVSGAAALTGRSRLRRATPPRPEQAVSSVRADMGQIGERAHR
jgi:hypothetical protein